MHTIGKAIEFIEKVFGKADIVNSKQDAQVFCPICGLKGEDPNKRKLSIKLENWLTHCWKCNYSNKTIFFLLKRFHPQFVQEFSNDFFGGALPFDEFEEVIEQEETIEIPEGFIFLAESMESKLAHVIQARKYLVERGATEKDFWYFKFGITLKDPKMRSRVIVPSFNSNGDLNYFTGRMYVKYDGKLKKKYEDASTPKTKIVFNEINIDWKEELTITEGPFDLIKCNNNATCLLGSALDRKSLLFQNIIKYETPVLLALDNDAKEKQLNIAKDLSGYGIRVRLYQIPSQYNDVGQMTKEEFIKGIENSVPYDIEEDFKFRIHMNMEKKL